MLTEIQCDKFIKDGKPRGPIEFHAGLNAVLGNDNGSNSIGKSTFLMILDFVFGGTDYVKRCDDVMKEVGEQIICFTFEFEGEKHYFSRSTKNQGYVNRCDEAYQPLKGAKPITVSKFCEFLSEKYGLAGRDLTWRGAVGRFVRVYKRDTLDEERPLMAAKGERPQDAIKSYMKLFNRYSAVEAQVLAAAKAKDEEESFRKSTQSYDHIRAARSKKERDENEETIKHLEEEKEKLADQNDKGLLSLDSVTASRAASLTDELSRLHRELASTQARLDTVREEITGNKGGFKRSFSELERFFPREDFKTLSEIETFHRELTKVLAGEFSEAESSLNDICSMLNERISALQAELSEIKTVPNVSQAALKEYARLDRYINTLVEANRNFDTLQRLKEGVKTAEAARDAVIASELLAIQESINPEMKRLTYEILDDTTHMAPVLQLISLTQYKFSTPNDGGTGAQHRSLITFDLANMAITPLPFVVHDSVLLKNIERAVLSHIFKVYASEENDSKQVFTAFDSIDSLGAETQDLLRKNCVLELSPNGNELFGWAWNKEKEE